MAEMLRSGARMVQDNFDTILIRCTGGVRDELEIEEQMEMLDHLFFGLQSHGILLKDRNQIDIISGYDEAAYAFNAANFLEKKLDHKLQKVQKNEELNGALDLGGSSTQITYLNNDGLFAQSYAGLGAQAVRARLKVNMIDNDPCAHRGDGVGTGNLDACIHTIRRLILSDNERLQQCNTAVEDTERRNACAVEPWRYEIPEPKSSIRFLAMCNFFYAADAIRSFSAEPLEGWPTPALSDLEEKARTFCALPWHQVRQQFSGKHHYTSDSLLSSRCFDAALVLFILRDVYALDQVTFLLETQSGLEVEWTLGYFLDHLRQQQDNTCSISTTTTTVAATNISVGDHPRDDIVSIPSFHDQHTRPTFAAHFSSTSTTPTVSIVI
eukprot:CAMPEP_0197289446 /NCGR_PEP_ID=MMETSP0890-20130614/6718_1 /TAXON_ID=44058 ORGANISM="Aureoumbra lagunensis, Strain CCMP1510" /NCGR_SAMPLE_ID=MMETSP0890 /ASSEMBLY_ACC=CAM_ASM_000533 /LENGTH=381 /DNA_ID=CAMNT_0042760877 /DNA_START=324 /DNA_END=1469 /DNA_ORIENTATION=+